MGLGPGHRRVGHHHPSVDRVGQRLAVAVEDVAARGGQLDGDRAALGRREGRVLVRAHALELHQPRTEERQHHGDEHEAGAEPQLGGAARARRRAERAAGAAALRRPAYGRTARPRGLVGAIALLPARGQWVPEWVACLKPCGWPGASSCWWPAPVVVRRPDDGHVGRRVQLGGLGRRRRQQPQRVEARGRGGGAEHVSGPEVEDGGAGGQHHAHPLRLERDDLRVTELVELHLEGLLAGDQVVGLVLQLGRRERRLLHRGVEQQQADDATDRDHRDDEQERDRAAPATTPPRDDGEAGPLEGGAGQTRDTGPEGGAVLLIRLLLWRRDGPVRRRAAGPRRRGGWLRSRRHRRARHPGDQAQGRLAVRRYERQVGRYVEPGDGGERLLDQPVLERVVGLDDHAAADGQRVDRGRDARAAGRRARR